jgi:PiT family inorganic phosphate transporter
MDFTLLIIIIVLALIFDYINGFHDAANSIATIVATKVLTPFQAVLWAAFFNFLAYWVFGFGVADTVAKTAHTSSIDLTVILAGVVAAIIWNLLTWWKGIPSSSSHTLIGGFAGAAIAHGLSNVSDPEHAGFKIVNWLKAAKEGELLPSGVFIVILFIVFAPLIGMIISYFISLWLMYSSKKNIYPKLLTQNNLRR